MQVILETRNRICHTSSTTGIRLHEINNMWETSENALLDLSQPERYKHMAKICIGSYRARRETKTETIVHGVSLQKETGIDELARMIIDLREVSKEQTSMLCFLTRKMLSITDVESEGRIHVDTLDKQEKGCQTVQQSEEHLVTTKIPNEGSTTRTHVDEQLQCFGAKQADKQEKGCQPVQLTEEGLVTTKIPNEGSTIRAHVDEQLQCFGAKQADSGTEMTACVEFVV